MKKLTSLLALTAVVANLGIATAFAAVTNTGTQVISCDTQTSQTFTNGTPANFTFSAATVSATSQQTTSNIPLEVYTCTTNATKTLGMYPTSNFVREDNSHSINITNLSVTSTPNMTCKAGGSCLGTVTGKISSATAFTGINSTAKIDLYDIAVDTNGTYETTTGVGLELNVPAATPAGTYVANFTLEIV
jgi:hypothetical protein